MSEAVREAYARGEEDEALEPLVLGGPDGRPIGRVQPGDYLVFYDIRGEREVELCRVLTEPGFGELSPHGGFAVNLATMIEYSPALPARVAFPPLERLQDTLCEVVCGHGLRIAKVAESEKAIHVGYFLNGRREEPFELEERIVTESARDVEHFDERPEMSVREVADATIGKLDDPAFRLTIANFANIDVVGHVENPAAIRRAIEAVDEQVGRVVRAAREAGVVAVLTADHGTVEKWYYPEGAVDTGHTDSPVPLAVAGCAARLREGGALTDVAPTVLALLGLPTPEAMTGRSLLPRRTG